MTMPPLEIEKELIDESTADPRDTASVNASPNGWPIRRSGSAGTEPGDEPEPDGRTHRALGKSLADITAGNAVGHGAATDAFFPRRPHAAGHGPQYGDEADAHASTGAGRCADPNHDCGRSWEFRPQPFAHESVGSTFDSRRAGRHQQGVIESPGAAPYSGRITDVYPPIHDRMLLAEYGLQNVDKAVDRLLIAQGAAATKDDVHELDLRAGKRIDDVHRRIDRDLLPRFQEQNNAIANLQKKRAYKDRVYPIWLTIATIGGILSLIVNYLLIFKKI